MRSILITGCNRGLGFGLVKKLAQSSSPPEIFATCRNVNKASDLLYLSKTNKNIHIIEIDLRHTEKYSSVVQQVQEIVGDAGLTVLFNNAGISTKFTRLSLVQEKHLVECLKINTVAPILLTKAFLPLLKQASALYSTKKPSMNLSRAAVINMSSTLGSIEINDIGGFYPYRCSKAALNAATKSMSIDLKSNNILVVALHPGWVKTSMGGSNSPMDVENCIENILNTLESLSEKDSGSFLQYDGNILPW